MSSTDITQNNSEAPYNLLSSKNNESNEHNEFNEYYEYNEYIYVIFLVIGVLLIIYGVKVHFDIYDSRYIPIKATITDVTCNRYIINRRMDSYHCFVSIEYQLNNKLIKNDIQTYGLTTAYYVG